ncbi:MAG: hypothetical protein PHY93_08265 [Bacteriovorax sp.]|nr:hypothetical protein [Bacteriovorax sp.]
MLKLFYKTLLVSILSVSLLLLDFSYQGSVININSLQAETLKTGAVKDDNLMATLTMVVVGLLASKLWSAKMTPDIMLAAAGGGIFIAGDIIAVFKNQKAIKELETEITRNEEGKIDQKQIEAIEKLKKSYMVAKDTATTKKNLQMAAAAAFAAAGITAFMMAADETALAASCLLGINGAVAAASTVLAVCQGFTTAATTAFTSASTLSPTCAGLVFPGLVASCQAEVSTFLATGAKQDALALDCNTEAAACSAKMGVDLGLVKAYLTQREIPSVSLPACAADTAKGTIIIATQASIAATCKNYSKPMGALELAGQCAPMAILGNGENSCIATAALAPGASNDIQKILYPNQKLQLENNKTYIASGFFERALSMILPSARAGFLDPLGIISSIAISVVLMVFPTLATMLDLSLLIPKRRAIAWGVLATLSLAASMATGSEIKKIEGNIKKIDDILNSMYALKNGVTLANNTSVTNPKIGQAIIDNKILALNAAKNQEIDLKANGGPGILPCITGDNSDNCPSFSEKLNAAQINQKSMPDFVQAQIGSIAKLTDGINGKGRISASTLDRAEAIASQQNALRSELLKQQKALQTKLKDSGSKMDLAREGDKLEASMKAAIQKELDSRKTTAGDILASFGRSSGLSGSGSSANDIATDASKDSKAQVSNKGLGAGGVVVIPAATASNSKLGLDKDAELEAKLAADKKAADEAAAAKETATASMDDYVLKNDITQDKDSSIFDLISNRYQKSYDRLFKRIK